MLDQKRQNGQLLSMSYFFASHFFASLLELQARCLVSTQEPMQAGRLAPIPLKDRDGLGENNPFFAMGTSS